MGSGCLSVPTQFCFQRVDPLRCFAEQNHSVARAAAIASRLADLGACYDAAPVFLVKSMRCLAAAVCIVIFAPPASGGIASPTCPPGIAR
jgi:hypothetical protein